MKRNAIPLLALGAAGLWRALARAGLVLAACGLALAGVTPAAAQPGPPSMASDRSVKAAYIYRFLPYVEWPATVLPPGAPIVIGVLAAEDLAQELEQIVRARTGDERHVVVRRLGLNDAWTGVHVFYLGQEHLARVQPVVKALQDRSVLTICDAEGAIDRGFVIGFVQVESRVRFEVNTEAADRSGLKLSSRLLTVALRVRTGAR